MPRLPRLDFVGTRHHVMNRGARLEVVFPDEEAGLWFMSLLAELPGRFALAASADDPALVDSAAQVTRLDSLPLRATPEINQAVRRVAAQTDAHLVDLEAIVPLAARASGKLHHDPVHLSARGHRVVAGAVVPVLEGLGF